MLALRMKPVSFRTAKNEQYQSSPPRLSNYMQTEQYEHSRGDGGIPSVWRAPKMHLSQPFIIVLVMNIKAVKQFVKLFWLAEEFLILFPSGGDVCSNESGQ